MASLFVSLVLALFPVPLARLVSPTIRRSVHPTSRIGFSFVTAKSLQIGKECQVGNLNYVKVDDLHLSNNCKLGFGNFINGRISVCMDRSSEIGNSNRIQNSWFTQKSPRAFHLGINSKVTSNHTINMAREVRFGNHCTLAGRGSQIWTHGYVHANSGPERYRVDGSVLIGNNVYIGSMSLILQGVKICDGVIIGGGTVVATNLIEPALYVSSPVRKLPRPLPPEQRKDLVRDFEADYEQVYVKTF